MLVLNLPFKALMFLTLMRPSLVLFLVLWLKLVKDFLKVRCRDRKSGSAGMPRPISYAVFCLKKKNRQAARAVAYDHVHVAVADRLERRARLEDEARVTCDRVPL